MTGPLRASKPTPARNVALDVLRNVAAGAQLGDALDRLSRGVLERRDVAFVDEVVKTVLRHRRYLDYQVDRRASRPGRFLDLAREILRLGAAELLFLRTPSYAAVNEATALARATAAAPFAPVINAVLRRLSEEGPAAVEEVGATRLGVQYSFPDWMTQRWVARLGESDAEVLVKATNTPVPLTVYPTPRKKCRAELAGCLRAAGCDVETGPFLSLSVNLGETGVSDLPGYKEGWFHIIDAASSLAPAWLKPQPGATVLDLCAGTGGKTFQLAWQVGPAGRVIAIDDNAAKLGRLRDRAAVLGVENVETLRADVGNDPLPPASYILLDAPCTNMGVIRRKPDLKWRLRDADVADAAALEKTLLRRALDALEPGGRLVYYVCSTEPEEGEAVIAEALSRNPAYVLAAAEGELLTAARDGSFVRTWPHRHRCNGGFGACIVREK